MAVNRNRQLLGVMVKQPQPGQVKSRLAAATSAAFAAAVAEAFLLDWLERLQKLPVPACLVYAPAESASYFAALAQDRCQLWPQGEGDLGQRLNSFAKAQLAGAGQQLVIIGTDSPTLPLAFLEAAFAELDRVDVVLGPATDGGYYLIGCSRHLPTLFDNIAWSSSQVLAQTLDRIAALGCRFALLPPWYDIDTIDDWRLLRAHVRALRLAGCAPQLGHTEKLLAAGEKVRGQGTAE